MGFADEQGKAMLESVDKPPASRFPPTDAERVILREAVVQWSRVREEKLKALVDLLGEQTPEPRFDKWRDHVRSLKDALATFCNTQARLAQPPPSGRRASWPPMGWPRRPSSTRSRRPWWRPRAATR
jgi:hypothetical protein